MSEYLWIQESSLEVKEVENAEGEVDRKAILIFETDTYETAHDNLGRLYRALVKEHGRCTGKVHLDIAGKTKSIGWVFIKRAEYGDAARLPAGHDKTYLQETWVTVHKAPPVKTITYDYAEIG